MNVSRRWRYIGVVVMALVLACTTGPTQDPAGVQVVESVPAVVPAEPPKPAPKPKAKPKPQAKAAQSATAPEPAKPEPSLVPPPPAPLAAEPPQPLSPDEIVPILGKKVLGPAGEDLGRVVNVLVDQTGRSRAAVIDFGGFLGVGSRKIAVAWDQLTFNPGTGDRPLVLNMSREQIQGAREYKQRPTEQVDVATPPTPGQTPTKPSN
jgi:PRC-barrel domain